MKILLIEPDQVLAGQYSGFLKSIGHQVKVAHDAQSAISSADTAAPELVILEVFLSKHSGLEFLYEFRSYPEWQNIPAIILSRAPESSLALAVKTRKDLGIYQILHKPETSLDKLGQKISQLTYDDKAEP